MAASHASLPAQVGADSVAAGTAPVVHESRQLAAAAARGHLGANPVRARLELREHPLPRGDEPAGVVGVAGVAGDRAQEVIGQRHERSSCSRLSVQ